MGCSSSQSRRHASIAARSVPAPAPKSRNIRYYASAAAASAAGFRPCLRCRPEAAPGSPLHRAKSELVAGALRLIEQGTLDETSLPELARRVGVGERHLRRLFAEELGASPLEVAATRRLAVRQETADRDGVADHGDRAGGRLREPAPLQRRVPRDVRQGAARDPARDTMRLTATDELVLRLPFRPPYDFAHLIGFLRAPRDSRRRSGRRRTSYRRSFVAAGSPGWLSVSPIAESTGARAARASRQGQARSARSSRACGACSMSTPIRCAINAHLRHDPRC